MVAKPDSLRREELKPFRSVGDVAFQIIANLNFVDEKTGEVFKSDPVTHKLVKVANSVAEYKARRN